VHDVRADVDPTHTVAQFAAAAVEFAGLATDPGVLTVVRRSTGEILAADRTVRDCAFLSGEVLHLGAYSANPTRVRTERGVSVDVLAGPDAGQSVVLAPGRYSVGRDPAAGVALTDPTVSTFHATIEVDDDFAVRLVPSPEATNPVRVDGALVTESETLGGAAIVQLGASAIAFRQYEPASLDERDLLGQVPFHRTPYRAAPPAERSFKAIGDVPTSPEPQRFTVLSAILPAASGVMLALVMGDPRFLLLTALTPVTIAANHFEQRRSTGRRHARALARFAGRLDRRRADLDAALLDERAQRVRAAPDVADLARRAELRTGDLWPRDRAATDFLDLRVGIGNVTPLVDVAPEQTGDDELRDEVQAATDAHAELAGVPVSLDLHELGVVAVVGAAADVSALATSLAVQAACLHSPEDLVMVAAVDESRGLADWLKWVPHTRSSTSPFAVPHLATDATSTDALLHALIEVAHMRTASVDRNLDRRWPWVLCFLDRLVDPDPSLLSQLLDRCPTAGISVVWITDEQHRVVRQAQAVVHCEPLKSGRLSELWFVDPAVPSQRIDVERVSGAVADRVARALAPIRDASAATATTAIPRVVPLFEALGVDRPSAQWVAEQWLVDRGYSLAAPVGMKADGPFVLDLVRQGPHGLIGGTSGAGKSELLQSIVVALMAHYPPTRLNFLFVDYKGGASSSAFQPVPHTVGYVTNLDAALSLRALTSLRAELNRRMQLMEGRAKDLEEMLELYPNEAPPSLVIVVDEFATLVKEVPEFVAGVVDIAQRGRSLGIHLILATQRPSGSVNDNILANTNLRISLRMLDSSESASIIGSPDAASIPVPLIGRGLARLGPGDLVAFQSAYSGAPVAHHQGAAPVAIEPFEPGQTAGASVRAPAPSARGTEGTHLSVLIESIVEAAAQLHMPAGRRPWLDVLADEIALDDVRADARARTDDPGRVVTIGTADDPAAQNQHPAVVDLETGGGLVLFGTGGTGKSTALRTIAAAIALDDAAAGGGCTVIYAIDFTSRALASLAALPQCGAVASGDDLESVTRVLSLLEGELDRRRARLGTIQPSSGDDDREPRIVVLVDGYANMNASLSGSSPESGALQPWLDTFHRLVVDGRQVGIHTVITADRRAAVPGVLMSAIANRIVLRQADGAGMADFALPAAANSGLNPGRGYLDGRLQVQLATPPESVEGAGRVPSRLVSRALPERVDPADLAGAEADELLRAVLGIADLTLEPVTIDFEFADLVVLGPPRSGRSTALAAIARDLVRAGNEVWIAGAEGSPLAHVDGAARVAIGKPAEVLPLLDELSALDDAFPGAWRVLIVDDADLLDDTSLHPVLLRLLRASRVRAIASLETRAMNGFAPDPLQASMRKSRRLLHLRPDSSLEVQNLTGVRAALRPGLRMPPGRGVLIIDREPTVVQVVDTVRGNGRQGR